MVARRHRDGQSAFDRANLAGEGEFSNHEATLEAGKLCALGHGNHPYGHRQIKARAFFFNIRWSEVDRRPLAGPAEAAVGNGGGDAILALAHGGIGKANDNDDRASRAGVHFHFDLDSLDPLKRG